jgi:hypothetical protein
MILGVLVISDFPTTLQCLDSNDLANEFFFYFMAVGLIVSVLKYKRKLRVPNKFFFSLFLFYNEDTR